MYRVSLYVLKAGRRIFRGASKAHAHGNYIRPDYVSVWKEAERQAKANHVSLSEFVSQALYFFMTGTRPPDNALHGRNAVHVSVNEARTSVLAKIKKGRESK
jgi:hypothetical protein